MHRAGTGNGVQRVAKQATECSLAKQATDGRAAVLAEAPPELVQAAEGGALRIARLSYEHVDRLVRVGVRVRARLGLAFGFGLGLGLGFGLGLGLG